MESLWWSLAPSVTAILLAMLTRQVIPSLLLGLWLGAFLVEPAFLGSVDKTMDYVFGTLSDRGNLNVLLFLYVFSGLVGMIQLSGGVQGFARWVERVVHTRRGALLAIWALEPITFIDCGFRVVATGAVMKPVTRDFGIRPERLAMMLNNSASPVVSLIPVATTFVAYMVGVVAQGLRGAGVEASAFGIFLQSIPLNFFSLTVILISLGSIFFVREEGQGAERPVQPTEAGALPTGGAGRRRQAEPPAHPAFEMETAEEMRPEPKPAADGHQKAGEGAEAAQDTAKDQMGVAMKHHMEPEPVLPPRPLNLILPVVVLIVLSFGLIIADGAGKGRSLFEIFAQADASRMMLLAIFLTSLFTSMLYLAQRVALKGLVDNFVKGGNKLMTTILILAVAWPIADVSRDLGLPRLIESTLGGRLPVVWVAPAVFLVSAAVTYLIGSSWGAWALMMPLALPLAAASGASLSLAAAAVFSGGTFGDVTSPLSGMTAMSAGIAEAEHARYVRLVTPYNLSAAAIAAVLFFAVPWLI